MISHFFPSLKWKGFSKSLYFRYYLLAGNKIIHTYNKIFSLQLLIVMEQKVKLIHYYVNLHDFRSRNDELDLLPGAVVLQPLKGKYILKKRHKEEKLPPPPLPTPLKEGWDLVNY